MDESTTYEDMLESEECFLAYYNKERIGLSKQQRKTLIDKWIFNNFNKHVTKSVADRIAYKRNLLLRITCVRKLLEELIIFN